MKKIAIILVLIMALFAVSCANNDDPIVDDDIKDNDVIELNFWSYPVGEWNGNVNVAAMLTSFNNEHPNIHVNATPIDYTTGDAMVREALANGTAPDIIFEGPERLVADWAANGHMADISDLWQDEKSKNIRDNVANACKIGDVYYEYPLCMTTHCMAINRDLFEAADAFKYIDEQTHTWTTENFIKAVNAINDYFEKTDDSGEKRVAAVYCGGQGGDQGTRALVNNLYGGRFTDPDHTEYTVDSTENIKALELLRELDGIEFDPTLDGGKEKSLFGDGMLAMSFCWNVSMEIDQIKNNVNLDFDIFPMAFPTNDISDLRLQGGIWGFGIFDNGDEKKIEAAKTFVEYLTKNDKRCKDAVLATGFWSVRDDITDPYVNDDLMNEYGMFGRYLGDYYQITHSWANARTAWWKMLQSVGAGADIKSAVEKFTDDIKGSAQEQ